MINRTAWRRGAGLFKSESVNYAGLCALTAELTRITKFSVMHMNAQSIRNKFPILKKELQNQGIDILLFSETWLTSMDDDNDYCLDDYNLYRWDRARTNTSWWFMCFCC